MTIQYTPLADQLLAYIDGLKAQSTPSSNSLNVNATVGADFFAPLPQILTANYGFDGYMGVPGLTGRVLRRSKRPLTIMFLGIRSIHHSMRQLGLITRLWA